MATMKVAAIQMCSTADVDRNNLAIADAVHEAAGRGAQLICLPEAANILLSNNLDYPRICRPEEGDETLALCRSLARERGVWLHTGSLLVRTEDGARVWNRSHVIAPSGDIVARYDKLHTFDVALGGKNDFTESLAVAPGRGGGIVVEAEGIGFGLSICYDIRFPYLFRALAMAGAQVLTIPASFSPVTGPLHWETLLKARAIETGCYVIAPGQCGTRDGVRTFGQSRIISPMGEVIAAAGDDPDVLMADIYTDTVDDVRRKLPVLMQTRNIETIQYVTPHVDDLMHEAEA
ncbi:carbon-nitrogen hydrolase family protein [Pelagibacterium flavum]|uniref:Carbon-nitrogen hydrolase family protein n=1 Tax=Pelagibacterium flavum TaxID=2984530 RepID=A0ABY6IRW3_9HYPH|nr:carbon-nitrogen hydrolase family protein [Pelagibacterium sp. YIM 151497]UYQ71955.1 carbon-nitrogen hydrolase family protein [Pelagibacterium sp. YIM 151497]